MASLLGSARAAADDAGEGVGRTTGNHGCFSCSEPVWFAISWLPQGYGGIGFGGIGTLIRHGFRGLAAAIGTLVVAVVEPSCEALLVTSVGFAELTVACQVTA